MSYIRKDITGKIFGRLVVLDYRGNDKHGDSLWNCRCVCGKSIITTTSRLNRGATKSCGCYGMENLKLGPCKVKMKILGQRFGRLVVIEDITSGKDGGSRWRCRCDCDNVVEVWGSSLRSGNTKSCGCLNREKQRNKFGPLNPNWKPNRREVEISRKIHNILMSLIHRTLKAKIGKTIDLIGYGGKELRAHLELLFADGMEWHNYGMGCGKWQIDHIKPIAAFVREGTIDPKIINALSNLRPMWASENASKNDKYEGGKNEDSVCRPNVV